MSRTAPEGMGLVCQGSTFDEVEGWLETAAENGFRLVQPVFFWNGYAVEDFERLAMKLKALNLTAPAFGIYSDLLKWDDPIGAVFFSTIEDLLVAADCASMIGTQKLVTWCGTLGEFAAPCEENRLEETLQTFRAQQERLLPTLQEKGLSLLFEPWRDHVLGDEHMTATACGFDPNHFQVVLDPPNFISPEQWEPRQERIASITQTLNPHVGLVHLKDMNVTEDGGFGLPMFGKGDLSAELANVVRPYLGQVPVMMEHFSKPEDIPELLDACAEYGLYV